VKQKIANPKRYSALVMPQYEKRLGSLRNHCF